MHSHSQQHHTQEPKGGSSPGVQRDRSGCVWGGVCVSVLEYYSVLERNEFLTAAAL